MKSQACYQGPYPDRFRDFRPHFPGWARPLRETHARWNPPQPRKRDVAAGEGSL